MLKAGGLGPRCRKPCGQTAPVVEPGAAAGLTIRQHTFCLAYLENSFNATQAYLTSHPGCGNETAQVNGHRTLRTAKVRAFLNDRLEAAWEPLQMGGSQALARVALLASDAPDDRVKLAASSSRRAS